MCESTPSLEEKSSTTGFNVNIFVLLVILELSIFCFMAFHIDIKIYLFHIRDIFVFTSSEVNIFAGPRDPTGDGAGSGGSGGH